MKDIVHHLKHLQKKVISSSRKEDAKNNSHQNNSVAPALPTEVSPAHKRKVFDSQLRKSSVRLHVH